MVKNVLRFLGEVVGDVIEHVGTGISREDIAVSVMELRAEVDQLTRENERLADEVDTLQFNGPTLYIDEIEALNIAMQGCDVGTCIAIRRLIHRSEAMPFTEQHLGEMARQAVEECENGSRKSYSSFQEMMMDAGKDPKTGG